MPFFLAFSAFFLLLFKILEGKFALQNDETEYACTTERFIYYRKSVLYLLKHMFRVHLSRCSTDLR